MCVWLRKEDSCAFVPDRKVVLQTTSPYLFYLKRSDGKSILLKQRHNKMMGDHGTREKIELRYADQC